MKYDINKLIKENSIVIEFIEGHGNYEGSPSCPSFHKFGRYGAKVNAYLNGELVYSNYNATTLPDGLKDEYVTINDGTPVPTVQEGIYKLTAKSMHSGSVNALYVESPTPVIRNGELSTSTGIFVHNGKFNDPTSYANSVGCQLIYQISTMFTLLGITEFDGDSAGILIVNRSEMPLEVYEHYKNFYPSGYSYLATNNGLSVQEMHASIMSSPELWNKVYLAMESGAKRGSFTPDEQTTLLTAGEHYEEYIKKLYNN